MPARPRITERLIRKLAAVHGQNWNASQIAQSLVITYPTVNGYLDFLEGAFLVRRLEPWQANLNKRLVKSPRIYWRDTGLLHALLDVETGDDLLGRPWVGASWEGCEIDRLIETQRERWAIEIKLTSSPGADVLKLLNTAADMVRAEKRVVISMAPRVIESGNAISYPLSWFLSHI